MEINLALRNQFRFNFLNKKQGNNSHLDTFVYEEDIYAVILDYKDNLSKFGLKNISNDTHVLESVIYLATGKRIYENYEMYEGYYED